MSTARQASRVTPRDLGLPGSPLSVGPRDTPEAVLRARVDAQLRALLDAEPGTRSGADPEDLHRMRVAVRRLRSVLRLSGSAGDEVRAELKWLGGALGEVRDSDVLIAHLRATVASFDEADRSAGDRLVSLLVDRAGAKRRLDECLDSPRYSALLRSAARLVLTSAPAAGEPAAGVEPVDVAAVVRKPYRKLVGAADLPAEPRDEELHALRIAGKRLRYAAETALAAARKKQRARVKSLIKATRRLQDVLGEHQDAVVAAARMRALPAEHADMADVADVAFVAGRIAEREHARRTAAREAWREAVSKVDAAAAKLPR